jgi:hypothetical protein
MREGTQLTNSQPRRNSNGARLLIQNPSPAPLSPKKIRRRPNHHRKKSHRPRQQCECTPIHPRPRHSRKFRRPNRRISQSHMRISTPHRSRRPRRIKTQSDQAQGETEQSNVIKSLQGLRTSSPRQTVLSQLSSTRCPRYSAGRSTHRPFQTPPGETRAALPLPCERKCQSPPESSNLSADRLADDTNYLCPR